MTYPVYVMRSPEEVLYVGRCRCILHRLREHESTKDWIEQVTTIEITRVADEEAGIALEYDLIQQLAPTKNIIGVAGRHTWRCRPRPVPGRVYSDEEVDF